MGRVIRYAIYLAFLCALLLGASWAAATFAVGSLLGSPPPKMGARHVMLEYRGVKRLRGRPIAWVYRFGPTVLRGAPNAVVYVGLTGHIITTEPPDLAQQLEAFHAVH